METFTGRLKQGDVLFKVSHCSLHIGDPFVHGPHDVGRAAEEDEQEKLSLNAGGKRVARAKNKPSGNVGLPSGDAAWGPYKCIASTCHCGASLQIKQKVVSKLIDLTGVHTVDVIPKQCTRSTCRTTYGYNYFWDDGRKISCVRYSDLKEGVLFISSKRGFTLRYLKYHGDLMFRGVLSAKSVSWAYRRSFADSTQKGEYGKDVTDDHHKAHNDALLYFIAMQELEPIGRHTKMEIGNELTQATVTAYSQYLHNRIYPHKKAKNVTVLVGDGHSKVLTRCMGGQTPKRVGRPRTRKRGRKSGFTNGWFMICEPQSGRVVTVAQQINPENNDDVEKAFERAIEKHPSTNTIVYDRNCSFAPNKSKNIKFKKVTAWPIDKWHGERHTKKCKYSSKNNATYKRRLRDVNTSICEQTFGWFRGYARILNSMRSLRNCFLVFYFVRLHNVLIGENDTGYLNEYATRPKRQRCGKYSCSTKKKKKM